ncbi:hypothetical protein O9929_13720 [Vibrio lentus]|nr:hypothetical protein [Vibrio lentus]
MRAKPEAKQAEKPTLLVFVLGENRTYTTTNIMAMTANQCSYRFLQPDIIFLEMFNHVEPPPRYHLYHACSQTITWQNRFNHDKAYNQDNGLII